MATCSICNHERRSDIEQACLLRNFGDTEVSLRDIAIDFGVDLKDLQVHALMHIPLEESNNEAIEQTDSIAGQIKKREATILRQVMEESYVTFKNIGSKINSIVAQHRSDAPTLVQITKPLADLYLGTAQSIRDTAEKLMKMDVMVNGDKNDGLGQIKALVSVLHGD